MAVVLTLVAVLVVLAVAAVVAVFIVRATRRLDADLASGPVAGGDDLLPGVDQPSAGWHGPSASGGFPAVPAQRTGEHDRTQRAPADRLHRERG
jgi:hypothetical protein